MTEKEIDVRIRLIQIEMSSLTKRYQELNEEWERLIKIKFDT